MKKILVLVKPIKGKPYNMSINAPLWRKLDASLTVKKVKS